MGAGPSEFSFGATQSPNGSLPIDLSLAPGSAVVWVLWRTWESSDWRARHAQGHKPWVSGFGRCMDNVGRGANWKISGLKVFRTVAQHLSFRKAAEHLFITQPAVTLQIKALEEDLWRPAL